MPTPRYGCGPGAEHCYCSVQLMVDMKGKPKRSQNPQIDGEYDSIAKWCIGKSHADKNCQTCDYEMSIILLSIDHFIFKI